MPLVCMYFYLDAHNAGMSNVRAVPDSHAATEYVSVGATCIALSIDGCLASLSGKGSLFSDHPSTAFES